MDEDDAVFLISLFIHFFDLVGLNEPGGILGGRGPKMCKTRVSGVWGGVNVDSSL
jgi:hypothetical protein